MRQWLLSTIIGAGCAFGPMAACAACYPGLGDCNTGPEPSNQTKYYYVGPVFPPDPWLALRSEPSSKAGYQIKQMPEGTLFRLLDTSGEWYKVQLQDGQIGWAHSHWIKCCQYLK
jgi:hypothetical protein